MRYGVNDHSMSCTTDEYGNTACVGLNLKSKADLSKDGMDVVAAMLIFTTVLSLAVLIYSIVKRRTMKGIQAEAAKTVEPTEDGFVKSDSAAIV